MNTERFTADERGVSEVVGAILVFALLVALLGIIQSQAVPSQNKEIEFQHNIEVQGDFVQFHQTASSVAAEGSERSVAFQTGTGYPSRLLFFNPPRVRGSVETTQSEDIIIDQVQSTDGEVNEYISQGSSRATQTNRLRLTTRRLVYQANYNEIQNNPTTRYEYGILYDDFENGGQIVENRGTVIDGTSINLLILEGDSAVTSTTETSLPVQPVSAPARSVTVTGTVDGGTRQPIVLHIPSKLDVNKWNDEYGGATNVRPIVKSSLVDGVKITLEPGTVSNPKQYNLRMSKIAVESGVTKPDAHYLVPVDPGVTSAGVGQPATIEYEVRDEFNNPVAGENVQLLDQDGNVVTSETSNDNGRVSFIVNTASTGNFDANLDSGTCSNSRLDRCLATYKVQVPGLNLNPASGIRLVGATTVDPLPNQRTDTPETEDAANCEPTSCEAEVTFENTNSNDVGMESIRINHYNPDPQGHSPVIIDDGSNTVDAEIGGTAKPATNLKSIAAGTEQTYTFTFNGEVHEGDYFVVTIIFDNNERALYFVSPKAN
jgi:FlaG/FlaF family flagellin (archaellin)